MMICPNCGAQNENDSKFCTVCGASISAEHLVKATPPPQPQPCCAPAYTPVQPGIPYSDLPPLSDNPAINIIKRVGSSATFLALVILSSISALCSLISSFFNSYQSNAEEVRNAFEAIGIGEYFGTWQNTVDSFANTVGTFIGSVVGMASTLLIVIALWLIYSTCRDRAHGSVKTTGFTIIKVINRIYFVIFTVLAGLIELACVALLALVSNAGSFAELIDGVVSKNSLDLGGMKIIDFPKGSLDGFNSFGNYEFSINPESIGSLRGIIYGIIIASMIFIAGVFLLILFYYGKTIKTVKTVRHTAQTGEPSDRVSMFVSVMCFIFGVIGGLSTLGDIVSLVRYFSVNSILGFISSACSSAAFIIGSLLIIRYRKNMRELLFCRAVGMNMAPTAPLYEQIPLQPTQNTPASPAPDTVENAVCPVCGRQYDASLPVCPYCNTDQSR